jgi:sulfatase modifying factor 1
MCRTKQTRWLLSHFLTPFIFCVLSVFSTPVFGLVCPTADMNGDCYVDLEDFAVLASQWLTGFHIPYDFVALPGGTFYMGDTFNEGLSDERPVHTVELNSFYMCRYEVTNKEYCAYLNSSYQSGLIDVIDGTVYKASSGTNRPYCDTHSASDSSQIDYSGGIFSIRTKGGQDMSGYPMVCVSWYGAAAYCNWRSLQEGKELCYNLFAWDCDFSKKGYRLPTEAEWEYAARGSYSNFRFPWGDEIAHYLANYYSSSDYAYDVSETRGFNPSWNDGIFPYTSPVLFGAPNLYKLKNMSGNVMEWANDWYSPTYYGTTPYPHVNPTGPVTGEMCVLRGGSWGNDAERCRVAARDSHAPYFRGDVIGFRLVLKAD